MDFIKSIQKEYDINTVSQAVHTIIWLLANSQKYIKIQELNTKIDTMLQLLTQIMNHGIPLSLFAPATTSLATIQSQTNNNNITPANNKGLSTNSISEELNVLNSILSATNYSTPPTNNNQLNQLTPHERLQMEHEHKDITSDIIKHVNAEYPLHHDLLCQKIAPLLGNQKATGRRLKK